MPTLRLALAITVCLLTAACTPKVGTPAWCDHMREKPKGEWTMDHTAEFTKHCIFPGGD